MYICYSFFLVVSFPGFSFPKSIFEKDHCLYADHKEESDFITQIKNEIDSKEIRKEEVVEENK